MRSSSSRRSFLRRSALGVGTVMATGLPALLPAGCRQPAAQKAATPGNHPGKLGVALVGLGDYSTRQLAPALQQTSHCYLAGVVSGSPDKAEKWRRQYNLPAGNIYNYQTFDQIADNPDIDVVYVVLPNAMHAEYTVRAAQAGKHVICEKPMAISVAECDQMIDACRQADRLLSVGYRMHFEPHHQRVMQLGQEQLFGAVRQVSSELSFVIGDPDQWRLDPALAGGGPLMDVGIYCLQGALYTLGQQPTALTAAFGPVTLPDKFDRVEESISWQMEFPGGAVADLSAGYNGSGNRLRADAERGWFELQPAYSYDGIEGQTSNGPIDVAPANQQARQMDAFATCIREKRPSSVSGEMGRRDVRLLMAIYDSARTGRRVAL